MTQWFLSRLPFALLGLIWMLSFFAVGKLIEDPMRIVFYVLVSIGGLWIFKRLADSLS